MIPKAASAPESIGEVQEVSKAADTLILNNSLCMQANIAKILAYTLTQNKLLTNIVQDEIWYNKYYDILESELGFSYLKKENALKSITYREVAELINEILGEGYGVNIDASDENLNKKISLNQFIDIYTSALKHTGKGIKLDTMDLVIVATPATNETLGAWRAATDAGEYGFEGIILDPLKNNTVRAVVKDKEILGITSIVSQESVLKQCYILKVEDKTAELQINNIKVSYDNEALSASEEGTICNVTIKENKIVSYEVQKNKNTDTLLKVTPDYVELKKAGRLAYEEVKVYDKREESSYHTLGQLPCGAEVEYICKEDKLASIQVVGNDESKNIRVVLSAPGRDDYVHDHVSLVSTSEYAMVYNNQTKVLAKEETWNADDFEWIKEAQTIRFVPKENSLMKVLSLKKQDTNPRYKGIIEVTKQGKGFIIVNELDLEDYVAGVIPSEMPLSYGLDAARVQAVAARTYAFTSKKSSKYAAYGAQIDDTTDSQVYNNVPPGEIAYEAAEETKGEILLYNGHNISSKFFAASCGYTANFGEVWASGETFPANTPVYLVSRQQYIGDKLVNNMSDEKDVYKFLKLKASEVDAFDKESPWFRWQVSLKGEELGLLVNAAVRKLTRVYPDLVKVLDKQNHWTSMEIDSVGHIKNMEVKKRGQGGNIMELVIRGDKATVKVSTEYLIRSLFSTTDKQSLNVLRADTTEVKSMSLLPSAFFSMDISYNSGNHISSIILYGGGFGHGVGMSQDGVRGMAARGYTYREILKHYYPNVEIRSLD